MPSFKKEDLMKEFNLTEDLYHEYQSAFDMFDEDHSGDISAEELVKAMNSLSKPTTLEEAKEMIKRVDQDGDGDIDFREFIIMMGDTGEEEEELRNAFDLFDADNSGYIDRDELKQVMVKLLGPNLTEDELTNMMDQADTDHDGQISFEEFKAMMGAQ
eukprot:CAMPEP_0117047120 /NCGR_PEP_ID=MMETSP0472-20121206/32577_1 /TAXON_ID=693140 ORGANISM="Tiarina fusus, Strain LIS" /NCGR_SAMPLE_ID=MMETSP0472 /ASSEMBLY_ACC=CAM_ASM_000603 /LENGTH=157 /DNA_ID=CAMNT_0004759725 /DNA_START=17 /DNA_END=490 /DNA_ORIENTATION=+